MKGRALKGGSDDKNKKNVVQSQECLSPLKILLYYCSCSIFRLEIFIAPNGIIKPLIKSIMIVSKTYKNYNIQTEIGGLKGNVDVISRDSP